ncbi:MAG TPA: hypothetical protein VMJ34_10210 [Bryobacteraceae bacterium]|nr:hypothetical protein [Bryobacteraceae bacterium]
MAEGSRRLSVLNELVRHFFRRFFDTESLSPQAEPEASVVQALGLLAAPGAFFVLVIRPLTIAGWDLVTFRVMFVTFSMVVMGFLTLFEWDALFLDRRDYQILTPLPVRPGTLFLAKTAALGIFLGIFLVDLNFFGVLFWPGVDAGRDSMAIMLDHAVAVLAAGLFAALAAAAIQGVLITLLRGAVLRRVSVFLQTVLMAAMVMALFLTFILGLAARQVVTAHHTIAHWLPCYWFAGFYERLRPATHDKDLLALGDWAVWGMAIAAVVFLLTYLPGYRSHGRRMLEAPTPAPRGPGRVRRCVTATVRALVVRTPVEQGVFHFLGQTITRSVKHRLFLATYGGFGAALAVMAFGDSERDGLLRLPLTLSFVLVSGLRAAYGVPSELGANWAFQMTETGAIGPYLTAVRKWMIVCAIVPLFMALAPMQVMYFGWGMALFHTAFGVTLSLLLMEILLIGFHRVPFTCSRYPGRVNLVGLSAVYVFGFTMYSRVMSGFGEWLAETPWLAAAFFLTAAAVLAIVRWHGRSTSGSERLDYADPVDPVVRTLDLTNG